MKEKLVEYIKGKYNPVAIVLHGSRANGNAREHSDWDFLIFTTSDQDPYREIVDGANMEIKQVVLPIADNELSKNFGNYFRTGNVETLYDPESVVASFLQKNDERLALGNTFNDKDRISRHAFLRWGIDAMGDYKDTPIIFFDKKSEFYSRVVPSWFYFKHKEFKPSDYIALPRIKRDDPEFYGLLEVFVKDNVDETINSGKRMIKLLFPDLD